MRERGKYNQSSTNRQDQSKLKRLEEGNAKRKNTGFVKRHGNPIDRMPIRKKSNNDMMRDLLNFNVRDLLNLAMLMTIAMMVGAAAGSVVAPAAIGGSALVPQRRREGRGSHLLPLIEQGSVKAGSRRGQVSKARESEKENNQAKSYESVSKTWSKETRRLVADQIKEMRGMVENTKNNFLQIIAASDPFNFKTTYQGNPDLISAAVNKKYEEVFNQAENEYKNSIIQVLGSEVDQLLLLSIESDIFMNARQKLFWIEEQLAAELFDEARVATIKTHTEFEKFLSRLDADLRIGTRQVVLDIIISIKNEKDRFVRTVFEMKEVHFRAEYKEDKKKLAGCIEAKFNHYKNKIISEQKREIMEVINNNLNDIEARRLKLGKLRHEEYLATINQIYAEIMLKPKVLEFDPETLELREKPPAPAKRVRKPSKINPTIIAEDVFHPFKFDHGLLAPAVKNIDPGSVERIHNLSQRMLTIKRNRYLAFINKYNADDIERIRIEYRGNTRFAKKKIDDTYNYATNDAMQTFSGSLDDYFNDPSNVMRGYTNERANSDLEMFIDNIKMAEEALQAELYVDDAVEEQAFMVPTVPTLNEAYKTVVDTVAPALRDKIIQAEREARNNYAQIQRKAKKEMNDVLHSEYANIIYSYFSFQAQSLPAGIDVDYIERALDEYQAGVTEYKLAVVNLYTEGFDSIYDFESELENEKERLKSRCSHYEEIIEKEIRDKKFGHHPESRIFLQAIAVVMLAIITGTVGFFAYKSFETCTNRKFLKTKSKPKKQMRPESLLKIIYSNSAEERSSTTIVATRNFKPRAKTKQKPKPVIITATTTTRTTGFEELKRERIRGELTKKIAELHKRSDKIQEDHDHKEKELRNKVEKEINNPNCPEGTVERSVTSLKRIKRDDPYDRFDKEMIIINEKIKICETELAENKLDKCEASIEEVGRVSNETEKQGLITAYERVMEKRHQTITGYLGKLASRPVNLATLTVTSTALSPSPQNNNQQGEPLIPLDDVKSAAEEMAEAKGETAAEKNTAPKNEGEKEAKKENKYLSPPKHLHYGKKAKRGQPIAPPATIRKKPPHENDVPALSQCRGTFFNSVHPKITTFKETLGSKIDILFKLITNYFDKFFPKEEDNNKNKPSLERMIGRGTFFILL